MKRKNIFLSSILSLACCFSLLVGSTFALFTSEKEISISVNAGNVEVEATVENVALYSPTSIAEKTGELIDATNAASGNAFANGGTAKFEGEQLTLDKMTPGDEVTFQIKITNKSDVAAKYCTGIKLVEDENLFDGLIVKIGGEQYNGKETYSNWTEFTNEGEEIVLNCSVTLPTTAGNEYKTGACKIAFSVNAVQGNTYTEDPVSDIVTDDASLAAAIEAGINYTVKEGTFNKTVVADNVVVTINGGTFNNQVIAARNGGTVIVNDATAGSAEAGGGPGLIANVTGGSTVIINGGSYMATTILAGDGTGTAEITGGCFDCGWLYISMVGKPVANLTITGGTFSSTLILGQSYGGAYIKNFVDLDKYEIINHTDGSCTVKNKE